MRCELCNQPATNINVDLGEAGEVVVRQLCQSCAEDLGEELVTLVRIVRDIERPRRQDIIDRAIRRHES